MKRLEDIRDRLRDKQPMTADDISYLKDLTKGKTVISREEAQIIFDIKDNLLGEIKAPSAFRQIFVDLISRHVLNDTESPYRIDEEEETWLNSRIKNDEKYDPFESKLLDTLRNKSRNFPRSLRQKRKWTLYFEKTLYSSRYLSILAVVGSLISALALFLRGAMVVFESIRGFFLDLWAGKVNPSYEKMFEELVSSVDIFLFALVLIIFAIGVYELFISKIDPIDRENDTRPSWLRVSSVDDLKSSLGKVILMVLIVSFFKHILELTKEQWGPVTLLYLSIGILLIAGALYLTHKSGKEGEEEKEK